MREGGSWDVARIGQKYEGWQTYGTVAVGDQSYGDGAYGKQFYGSGAHGHQTYGQLARGSQYYGNQARGDQYYGSNAQGEQHYGEDAQGHQAYAQSARGTVTFGKGAHSDQDYGWNAMGAQTYGFHAKSTITLGSGSKSGAEITGTIHSHSDKRLKDNITTLGDITSDLAQIGIYSFNRNDENDRYEKGVIAQEVQLVLSDLVKTEDKGDMKDCLSINYAKLGAISGINANQQILILQQQLALMIKRIEMLEK
jgi:hypothetical protein